MGQTKLQEGQAELPTPESTHSYWHHDPSLALLGHRTTQKLPSEADVVVIGSGITGAFAANTLVSKGRSVLMLEAREACWGATGRVRTGCAASCIEPSTDDPKEWRTLPPACVRQQTAYCAV